MCCEDVRSSSAQRFRLPRPAAVVLLILALLLGGCGSSADTEAPGAAGAAAAAQVPAQATTPAQVPTLTQPAPHTPTRTAAPLPEPTPTAAPKRVQRARIAAPSLAGNLVGEPAERTIVIYLPPSYFESEKRYPVVYYLPGFGDSDFIGFQPGRDADPLFASGALPEMIFVVASGKNVLQGSFYANSPVTGNWEDLIAQDVVGYVDANFRTLPDAAARLLAGHSMGGFGALHIGMRHPELFGAVYSMSPGLFDPDGLAESQMFSSERTIEAWLRLEEQLVAMDADSAMDAFLSQWGDLGFVAAYGAAFAPNPDRHPPLVDYPYRSEGGALVRDEAVWQRWESGFGGIAASISQYEENLRALRGLVIDYGTRDSYAWIPKGAEYLGAQLEAAGIPHELRAFDGGHQDQLGRRIRDQMLPFFAGLLELQ